VTWSYPELVLSADEEDIFYRANNDGQTGIQLHSAPALLAAGRGVIPAPLSTFHQRFSTQNLLRGV
jgi:hypothetical protein